MPLWGRSRTAYKELPGSLKRIVRDILQHRRDYQKNAAVIVTGSASLIGIVFPLSPTVGVVGSVVAGLKSIGLHRMHDSTFREEYMRLYHELRQNQSRPAVHSLLTNPRANYIIVKWNGDLETRQYAPRLWKQPIGKRRIENPLTHRGDTFVHLRNFTAARKRKKVERVSPRPVSRK